MTLTKIEWTDQTWNPVTGCTEVSPGCDYCYARTFAERWRGTPGHPYARGFDIQLRHTRLLQPLRWRDPVKTFVCSMSDLFHAEVPDDYIAHVFAILGITANQTYQVLTKRHARARALLSSAAFQKLVMAIAEATVEEVPAAAHLSVPASWPLPNVWLGVSAENQAWADIRLPALVATPAAVRFVSAEPLVGPLDLTPWLAGPAARPSLVDWVIAGGESGPGARPADARWIGHLVTTCRAATVPVFVKQLGSVWSRNAGLGRGKGNDPTHWPPSLRVRQFPRPPAVAPHAEVTR
jgi:protein gp37